MKLYRYALLALLVVTVMATSFGCDSTADRPDPARYNQNQGNNHGVDQVGYGVDQDFRNVRDNRFNRDTDVNDGFSFGRLGDMLGFGNNRNNNNNAMNENAQGDTMTARLEERVQQIAGVNDCTVVVEGDNCYVAVDTDNEMLGQYEGMNNNATTVNFEQIKAQVRQVLSEEGQFNNIIVSEDQTFGDDLNTISNEIRSGRPVTDFEETLREMGRAMMPARNNG